MASIVTQEDVEAQNAVYSQVHHWEVVKEVASNTYLVRRKTDGELFLGYPWEVSRDGGPASFNELLQRGTKTAVAALLNHPNLVCHVDTQQDSVMHGLGDKVRGMSLWDYCDLGSLEYLLDKPPTRARTDPETGRVEEFMPESLCWHVMISMLRALAWLHEGYREEDCIELDAEGKPQRLTRGRREPGEDWLPILHRNIKAANIFFQRPRGSETYGFCKLGDFSKCFVSGHVNAKGGGHAVTSDKGSVTQETLRHHMANPDIYSIPKGERPYVKGTEFYHLGGILYRMMTGKTIPDREECSWPRCGARHWDFANHPSLILNCPFGQQFNASRDVVATVYSDGLGNLLSSLLKQYRSSGQLLNAIDLLKRARAGYLEWKGGWEDGSLHRDYWDDMVLRMQNGDNKYFADKEIAKAQSAPGARDIMQEQGWE